MVSKWFCIPVGLFFTGFCSPVASQPGLVLYNTDYDEQKLQYICMHTGWNSYSISF